MEVRRRKGRWLGCQNENIARIWLDPNLWLIFLTDGSWASRLHWTTNQCGTYFYTIFFVLLGEVWSRIGFFVKFVDEADGARFTEDLWAELLDFFTIFALFSGLVFNFVGFRGEIDYLMELELGCVMCFWDGCLCREKCWRRNQD